MVLVGRNELKFESHRKASINRIPRSIVLRHEFQTTNTKSCNLQSDRELWRTLKEHFHVSCPS